MVKTFSQISILLLANIFKIDNFPLCQLPFVTLKVQNA